MDAIALFDQLVHPFVTALVESISSLGSLEKTSTGWLVIFSTVFFFLVEYLP